MTNEMLVGATERTTNPTHSTAAANAEPCAAMGDAARKLGEQVADVGGQVCREAAAAGRYVRQQVEGSPGPRLSSQASSA